MSENEKDMINDDIEENDEKMTEEEKKADRRAYIKSEIIDWIKTIVGAAVFAWFITTFIVVNATVPTGSMKNTIMPGDRIVAFRLSYIFSEPERYDICVFKYPDDESILYVKRIIGMPGDTVNIIDGKVYINDSAEPIPDEYIREPMLGTWGPYNVPEGHYFMLGDNRNESKDSRLWKNTYVEKDKILGKAIFKYYPSIESLTNK